MKAIVLAAGKTNRSFENPNIPVCMQKIEDSSLLEVQLNTLHNCGIREISIVRGFRAEQIDYPGLTYFENKEFENSGVLHSLWAAEEVLNGDVLILYSDILYDQKIISRVISSRSDFCLGVHIGWNSVENRQSTENVEIIKIGQENNVDEIGKGLSPSAFAQGKFTGILKLSERGVEIFKRHYFRAKTARIKGIIDVKTAWLTDLLSEMSYYGVPLSSVIIENGFLEIGSQSDLEFAAKKLDFIREHTKIKTDWGSRSHSYNNLDWVSKDILLSAVVETVEKRPGKKLLDLGTGTGKVIQALYKSEPNMEYHGLDYSAEMLGKIEKHFPFHLQQGVIEDLKYSDDSFDIVTARMVFHHSHDPIRAAKEAFRVLKPGGQFIICEGVPPNKECFDFYTRMFSFKENRNSFLQDDLTNLLHYSGFCQIFAKTIFMKNMSLNNWLSNAGVPKRNIEIIREMHIKCEKVVENSYNMKVKDGDLFMDWKFVIAVGYKLK